MQWLIQHLASGDLFVAATVALLFSLPILSSVRLVAARVIGLPLIAVAVALIGLSSIPLPKWFVIGWFLLLCVAMVIVMARKVKRALRVSAVMLAQAAGVVALGMELPRRHWAGIAATHLPRLYVVGDSLSAGMGHENGQTWPRLLAIDHRIEVVDLAAAGATTSSIQRHLSNEKLEAGLVILEIGGNDVFMSKPPEVFERDLDALISRLVGPQRTLVMFELPLHPLRAEYGRVQRRVAAGRNVSLIPRQYLADVIATPGNTIDDGIHLSIQGQRQLADLVWKLMGESLAPTRQS